MWNHGRCRPSTERSRINFHNKVITYIGDDQTENKFKNKGYLMRQDSRKL